MKLQYILLLFFIVLRFAELKKLLFQLEKYTSALKPQLVKKQNSPKHALMQSFYFLFRKIMIVLGLVFWMIFVFIYKKIFASELVCHGAGIVDFYLLRVSALPNSIGKSLAPPNTTSSNTPKASDIPLSEWKIHFSNEFKSPDSTLEYKYELGEFLSVYLGC